MTPAEKAARKIKDYFGLTTTISEFEGMVKIIESGLAMQSKVDFDDGDTGVARSEENLEPTPSAGEWTKEWTEEWTADTVLELLPKLSMEGAEKIAHAHNAVVREKDAIIKAQLQTIEDQGDIITFAGITLGR